MIKKDFWFIVWALGLAFTVGSFVAAGLNEIQWQKSLVKIASTLIAVSIIRIVIIFIKDRLDEYNSRKR